MTAGRIAQVVMLATTLVTCVGSMIADFGEKGLLSPAATIVVLGITGVASAFLPKLAEFFKTPPSGGAVAVALFVLLTPGMSGCAELQSAKQPAQEIWDAAELLCQQDLASVPDIAPVQSALALMQEVCDDLAVAKPYVELIQQYGKMSEQTRSSDPRARARANAVAAYKARAEQK